MGLKFVYKSYVQLSPSGWRPLNRSQRGYSSLDRRQLTSPSPLSLTGETLEASENSIGHHNCRSLLSLCLVILKLSILASSVVTELSVDTGTSLFLIFLAGPSKCFFRKSMWFLNFDSFASPASAELHSSFSIWNSNLHSRAKKRKFCINSTP